MLNRAPPSGTKSGRNYETNGWFFADDAIANLWKNRFVITMPLMGMPVSHWDDLAINCLMLLKNMDWAWLGVWRVQRLARPGVAHLRS